MELNNKYIVIEKRDIKIIEIIEGSIIEYHFDNSKKGIVRFGQYRNCFDDEHGGHVGFYVDWQDEELKVMARKDLLYWVRVSKVVGHIYETPELLNN